MGPLEESLFMQPRAWILCPFGLVMHSSAGAKISQTGLEFLEKCASHVPPGSQWSLAGLRLSVAFEKHGVSQEPGRFLED